MEQNENQGDTTDLNKIEACADGNGAESEVTDLNNFHISETKYYLISSISLEQLKYEIEIEVRKAIDKLIEYMNTKCVEARMAIASQFCMLEAQINTRFDQLHEKLVRRLAEKPSEEDY